MKKQGFQTKEVEKGSNPDSSGALYQDTWQILIDFIKTNNLSKTQIKKIFSTEVCDNLFFKQEHIPVAVFDNSKLSVLEAVVKYLKEVHNMRLKEISAILNRDSKTIWTTYNNAAKKMSESFSIDFSRLQIPLELFKDRSAGPLEVVVRYLKDEFNLKNNEIAKLLHRDQRTIWATYNRRKK